MHLRFMGPIEVLAMDGAGQPSWDTFTRGVGLSVTATRLGARGHRLTNIVRPKPLNLFWINATPNLVVFQPMPLESNPVKALATWRRIPLPHGRPH